MLFFSADSVPGSVEGTGRELWMHNAATGETREVADIRPGSFGGGPNNLTVSCFSLPPTATGGLSFGSTIPKLVR